MSNYSTAATAMLQMQAVNSALRRIYRSDTAAPVIQKKGAFDKEYRSYPEGMSIVPFVYPT